MILILLVVSIIAVACTQAVLLYRYFLVSRLLKKIKEQSSGDCGKYRYRRRRTGSIVKESAGEKFRLTRIMIPPFNDMGIVEEDEAASDQAQGRRMRKE